MTERISAWRFPECDDHDSLVQRRLNPPLSLSDAARPAMYVCARSWPDLVGCSLGDEAVMYSGFGCGRKEGS